MWDNRISRGDMIRLQRWNTPSVYNGWKQITKHDPAGGSFNRDETRDFMADMAPLVGFAVTLVVEPSQPGHQRQAGAVRQYRDYVASLPEPKVVVVQDLDSPAVVGSFWGEVNATLHRALGCSGTITDGAIRDVDEMCTAGFKALARRLCVGNAHVVPVRWNCEVEVFGCKVTPGQLVHGDKHGFIAVPRDDETALLDAVEYMDRLECDTVLAAIQQGQPGAYADIVEAAAAAGSVFSRRARERFAREGEW